MASRDARWAARQVDREHVAALSGPNPVLYLRARQAEAELRYLHSGDRRDLALVRAFAASLDGDDYR